jgi:hypothetical protein
MSKGSLLYSPSFKRNYKVMHVFLAHNHMSSLLIFFLTFLHVILKNWEGSRRIATSSHLMHWYNYTFLVFRLICLTSDIWTCIFLSFFDQPWFSLNNSILHCILLTDMFDAPQICGKLVGHALPINKGNISYIYIFMHFQFFYTYWRKTVLSDGH